MVNVDDRLRAQDIAARTMRRIESEGLSPNPENYTLWYSYYGGQMPDLSRAIDIARRDGGPLSQSQCNSFYQRFFTLDLETRAVRETSERARLALGRIIDQLETLGGETARYGTALEGFCGELEQPISLPDLRAVVAAIAAETVAIAERQQSLQAQIVASSHQLEEMRVNLDTARREALTDGLTGIANRKAFDHVLVLAAEEAVAEGLPLSLLMVDIDHFKLFNDTHGHLVGDHVLKLVGRALTESIKGRDTAARYGGEEFAIILPRTELENAVTLGEQVRTTVGSRQIVNKSRNVNYGCVTLSLGAAQYIPGESLDSLIQRADSALYEAKRRGRNMVVAGPI